jgi:diaminopimelate decarboxylase/aspartate kinase
LRPNHSLADGLGLDISELIGDTEHALNVYLEDGVPPSDFAAQAQILSLGELMSSRIGAAWLADRGHDVSWQDARQALQSRPEPKRRRRQYLDARCSPDADIELQERWSGAGIIVTQGFLARNDAGQTVLLGRGGSDTSAAYLAAALEAARVEIWSDVPGLFSTDPRLVTGARLLRRLDFNEALEIAVAGGAVIHPQCIHVAKAAGLELQLGQLGSTSFPGTVISDGEDTAGSVVKAVSLRRNMATLLLENQDMRQAVGFLARVFGLFAEHGISLDQVATSETTTTVSLDLHSNHVDLPFIEELAEQLRPHCTVKVLAPSACVSLVGRGVRQVLSDIGNSMQIFKSEPLWLASYSANDLAYTLVVPEALAEELLKSLHAELVEKNVQGRDLYFGPDWTELQSGSAGYG